MLLTIILSLIIGLLLGLLGGGGSILTVPMLVYVLGVDPKLAIMTAFVVIGSSSVIALIPHAIRSAVCWKSGFWFGLSGMSGAFCGGRLGSHFSNNDLMTLFGAVSLLIGLTMLKAPRQNTNPEATELPASLCPLKLPIFKLLTTGFSVGAITGMVGVGGGFLIVPALSLLVGLPIQGAIGTSLLIIILNAIAGIAGYSQQISLDIPLALLVASGTIVGSAIGAILSAYVQPRILKRSFALLVVVLACYVLYQSLHNTLLISVHNLLIATGVALLLLGWQLSSRLLHTLKASRPD